MKGPWYCRVTLLSIAFYALAVAALSTWLIHALTADRLLFGNDIGFSYAVGLRMLHGEFPLLGPPSHLGGRSPGAFYYYFVAACLALSRSDPLGASKVAAVAELVGSAVFFAALSLVFLGKRGWLLGSVLSLLMAVSGRIFWMYFVPWHANFLILPGSFFFSMAIISIRYGRRTLPAFFFSGSVFGLSSLSCVPIVGGVGAFVVIYSLRGEHSQQPRLIDRWISGSSARGLWAVLFVISVAPTISYEFLCPSNVLRIASKHETPTSAPAGMIAAAQFSWRALTAAVLDVRMLPFSNMYRTLAQWLYVAATVAVLGFISWKNSFRWKVLGMCAVAVVSTAVSLSRVEGILNDYYLNPLFELVVGLTGVSLAAGVHLSLTKYQSSPAWPFCGAIAASLLVWIVAVPIIARSLEGIRDLPSALFPLERLSDVRMLSTALQRNAPDLASSRLLIRGQKPLRENAVYFLLGDVTKYPFMQYADQMPELPTFQNGVALPHAVLVHCDAENASVQELLPKMSTKWEMSQEIELSECPNCSICRAYSLLAKPNHHHKRFRD